MAPPADQENVTLEDPNVEPGAGLVITAPVPGVGVGFIVALGVGVGGGVAVGFGVGVGVGVGELVGAPYNDWMPEISSAVSK